MYNWRWAGSMTFISVFGLFAIYYMAMELEDPFSNNANNLPLVMYQDDANRVLMTMLHPRLQKAPKFHGWKSTKVDWPGRRENEEQVLKRWAESDTAHDKAAMTARRSQLGALIGEFGEEVNVETKLSDNQIGPTQAGSSCKEACRLPVLLSPSSEGADLAKLTHEHRPQFVHGRRPSLSSSEEFDLHLRDGRPGAACSEDFDMATVSADFNTGSTAEHDRLRLRVDDAHLSSLKEVAKRAEELMAAHA